MLRFVADENFNYTLVRRLLREFPQLDIIRIQDVGLSIAIAKRKQGLDLYKAFVFSIFLGLK